LVANFVPFRLVFLRSCAYRDKKVVVFVNEENLHTTFKNKLEGLYEYLSHLHQNLVMILLEISSDLCISSSQFNLFLDLQLKECTYDQSQILNS
jgi:hypothetical protein